MPSIFSRTRTSTAPQSASGGPSDEFGRVSSRNNGTPNTTTSSSKRTRTLSTGKDKTGRGGDRGDHHHQLDAEGRPLTPLSGIPDGSFIPFSIDKPSSLPDVPGQKPPHAYGYLSHAKHVILGADNLARLVSVVCEELTNRGALTTPLIFSPFALDISSHQIKQLVDRFVDTCAKPSEEAERRWRDEARFAGLNELGMMLRWGMSRVVRVVGGREARGVVGWDAYVAFRDSEAAMNYPPHHLPAAFLALLLPPVQHTLVTLLTLLSRLTAHSNTSGHTPPSLSPIFGPLLFGLGPPGLDFHGVYFNYMRATTAMEHLLLAFVRWQDSPVEQGQGGSASTLGVPLKLKSWIQSYPSSLPPLLALQDPSRRSNTNPNTGDFVIEPRPGAPTTRVYSVRRNVRMYSADLVRTSASWGEKAGVGGSRIWEGICPNVPESGRMKPRYSDRYRKRLALPKDYHPDTGLPSSSAMSSPSNSLPYGASMLQLSGGNASGSTLVGDDEGGDEDASFRTLTDMKWGNFTSRGFGGKDDVEERLKFDLGESARAARTQKRSTLSWSDFSASGFTRPPSPPGGSSPSPPVPQYSGMPVNGSTFTLSLSDDLSLATSLAFSTPVPSPLSSSNSHSGNNPNAEITKKLKKTMKGLPSFGWDTEPVLSAEERWVEEAFVGVWGEVVCGAGWSEGDEGGRECVWALVEFRSLPTPGGRSGGAQAHGQDPRTGTTLLLFEEFVPLEYRQALAQHNASSSHSSSSARSRLPSLFSPSKTGGSGYTVTGKSKPWKAAPTLNGRPYVVGQHPRVGGVMSKGEAEFEGMLRRGGETRVVSLSESPGPGQGMGLQAAGGGTTVNRASHPMNGNRDFSAAAGGTPTKQISAPLFQSPKVAQSASGPIPTPAPQVNPPHPHMAQNMLSPTRSLTPSRSPSDETGTPSKLSKFRLSTPSSKRQAMTPAEYSSVDFSTRMARASGSDGDEWEDYPVTSTNSSSGGKKDDLDDWVDILVGSQARRMDGQSASSPPRRKAVVDPMEASMEVERTLAELRGGREGGRRRFSSDDEGGMEPVDEPLHQQHHDEDVDEVLKVPRKNPIMHDSGYAPAQSPPHSQSHSVSRSQDEERDSDLDQYTNSEEEGEDDDPNSARNVLKRARERRLKMEREGYFSSKNTAPSAAQPDEASVGSSREERLAYDEEDEEVYTQQPQSQLPVRSLPQVPESYPDGKRGKTRQDGPAPALDVQKTSPPPPPAQLTTQQPQAPANNGAAQAAIGNKTSSLIEMYRQREAQAQQAQSPQSRIPVRIGGPRDAPGSPPQPAAAHPTSLSRGAGPEPRAVSPQTLSPPLQGRGAPRPVSPGGIGGTMTSGKPAQEQAKVAPSTGSDDESDEGALDPPPQVIRNESGRASPGRYMHGQPLHNVVEEEED